MLAGEQADWRKVGEAHIYKGEEMMPPKYIDANSTLLTSDGYIVFRSILPGFTQVKNGKIRRLSYRNFNGTWQYEAIHCSWKMYASSRILPKFLTTSRNYAENDKYYYNKKPRNVESILCNKSGIRRVPQDVGTILYLNYKPEDLSIWDDRNPPSYDDAIMMGLIE